MSHRTGRSLRLAMVNLRFEPHGTFDGLGDKAILLRFLKYPRHSSKILEGRDHDPRLNDDLGYLITAPCHFLELTLRCRSETHQRQLGILSDSEKRKHKADVDRGNKKMFRRPLPFPSLELRRSTDSDRGKSGPLYLSRFFFGPLDFRFIIEDFCLAHLTIFGLFVISIQPV
jgi:hypothetical protein